MSHLEYLVDTRRGHSDTAVVSYHVHFFSVSLILSISATIAKKLHPVHRRRREFLWAGDETLVEKLVTFIRCLAIRDASSRQFEISPTARLLQGT
jgi:hypothetical protein